MGNTVMNRNVLVVGPRNAGKTHVLDMLTFGPDSTKIPTMGFYETSIDYYGSRINLYECSNVEFHTQKRIVYHMLIMVLDPSYAFEELQRAKNMLFSIALEYPKICILYNFRKGSVSYSFSQRNSILQLQLLSRQRPVSVVEINFAHDQEWQTCINRIFQWLLE